MTPEPKPKKVLFLCIGNSCRSQMAEGFARTYGRDVLIAASAGLAPALIVQPLTAQVMIEKNIRLDEHFPKGLDALAGLKFDLVVNMSGLPLPVRLAPATVEWNVRDPIGEKPEVYRQVANQIEGLVMRLILELRSGRR